MQSLVCYQPPPAASEQRPTWLPIAPGAGLSGPGFHTGDTLQLGSLTLTCVGAHILRTKDGARIGLVSTFGYQVYQQIRFR